MVAAGVGCQDNGQTYQVGEDPEGHGEVGQSEVQWVGRRRRRGVRITETEERQVQVLIRSRTGEGEDKFHGEVISGAVEASLSDVHHLETEKWM